MWDRMPSRAPNLQHTAVAQHDLKVLQHLPSEKRKLTGSVIDHTFNRPCEVHAQSISPPSMTCMTAVGFYAVKWNNCPSTCSDLGRVAINGGTDGRALCSYEWNGVYYGDCFAAPAVLPMGNRHCHMTAHFL